MLVCETDMKYIVFFFHVVSRLNMQNAFSISVIRKLLICIYLIQLDSKPTQPHIAYIFCLLWKWGKTVGNARDGCIFMNDGITWHSLKVKFIYIYAFRELSKKKSSHYAI